MAPGDGLDSQLKQLRHQHARDWASDRFFAATARGPAAAGGGVRAARWRPAALLLAVALALWAANVYMSRRLPAPQHVQGGGQPADDGG